MKKLALLVFVLFIMVGCTYVPANLKTDIQPYGPDTYTLNVGHENGSFTTPRTQADLKSDGISKAQAYCKEMNKQFMPVESIFSGRGFNLTYDLTFRCLDKGDPELTRPEKGTEIIEPPDSGPGSVIILPPYIPPYPPYYY